MGVLKRIVELVATGQKLSAAKPHVLSALTGLTAVIILGVFATVMAALMVCTLIWLAYAQLLVAGVPVAAAGGGVALFSFVILAIIVLAVLRIWHDVRQDVTEIFGTQTPHMGVNRTPRLDPGPHQGQDPAPNPVSAFIAGLKTSSRTDKSVQ